MIDFTSSLYLGMQHSSAELAPGFQLSSGKPAALFEPGESKALASQIARMQGLESGYAAPSTLHLFSDLYNFLSKKAVTVYIDKNIYPVSKYGIEKLYLNKIPTYLFRHLDATHLQELLATRKVQQRVPVIITDGWCPECGRAAPLNIYSEILKPYAGRIIVDDTQALGIFGTRTGKELYGKGGGGTLQWLNVKDPGVVSIMSLAKAFGVPIAAICAGNKFIESFRDSSQTIAYSSPPSLVHLRAGLHSLKVNKETGDNIRRKLFNNISLLRSHFRNTSLKLNGGIFPVQSLSFRNPDKATAIFDNLYKQGIQAVLTTNHDHTNRSVTFVIRSDHSPGDIEALANCIKKLVMNPIIKED